MATCRLHKIRPIGRQVPPLLVRLSLELVPRRVQLLAGDQEGTHAYISISLYFYVSMLQCIFVSVFIFSRFSIFYVPMFLGFYHSLLILSDISMLLCSYFSTFQFFFLSHKIIA